MIRFLGHADGDLNAHLLGDVLEEIIGDAAGLAQRLGITGHKRLVVLLFGAALGALGFFGAV